MPRRCVTRRRRAACGSLGHPVVLSQALSHIAFIRLNAGEGLQREMLMRADALEREGSGRGRDDTPLQILGLQLNVVGELAEARELSTASASAPVRAAISTTRISRCSCSPSSRSAPGAGSSRTATRGRALELTLGAERWNSEAAGHWICALVDAHLGRVESARAHAETGRQPGGATRRPGLRDDVSHMLGFVSLSLGDAEAAVRHLAPLPAQRGAARDHEPSMFCIAPDLAEALALAGDLAAARDVQARARIPRARARPRVGGRHGAALPRPHRRRRRPAGRRAGGSSGGRGAARGSPAAVRPRAHAAGARHSAEAGEAAGATRASRWRRRWRSSRSSARRCGRTGRARRSRRLGGRRAKDSDELTETERRIAELAADGRSNREIAGELFVSERTVEANLTRAYRKLGVRSRTELARRLPTE